MDREKVIKAVDICRGNGHCEDCQYYQGHAGYTIMDCRKYLLNDALALLKEQEEIIHCKDCYYYHKPEYGFTFGDCTRRSAWYSVAENEFCSLAKRKEGR